MFNVPIFKLGWGNKAYLLLQTNNNKEDLLTLLIRKQEKMETSELKVDLDIENSEKEI